MKMYYNSPEMICVSVFSAHLLAQSTVSGSGIDYGDPIDIPGSDIF